MSKLPRSIWWEVDPTDGIAGVYLIDQTRLPLQGDVLCCRTLEGVELAIKSLAVRGAPALGVAAAMAVALFSENESRATTPAEWLGEIGKAAERIAAARPTAVNLSWGAERALDCARREVEAAAAGAAGCEVGAGDGNGAGVAGAGAGGSTGTHGAAGNASGTALAAAKAALVAFACQMAADDEAANRAIGANGAALLLPSSNILTICNAGSLATAYYGTALGVVYTAFDQGKVDHVWVSETRPVNQGARLTAWELSASGVPHALITDSMAASVMAAGWVDAVLVGADRICSNGDVANKIGTLALAVLAKHYAIPFYVAAPEASIDRSLIDGSQITIEQRDPRELSGFTANGVILPDDAASSTALDLLTADGVRELKFKAGHVMSLERKGGAYSFDAWFATTPPATEVYNPAFDVTPSKLITAIITENGVYNPDNLG